MLFDNTYSYLRSKKLHYTIGMAPPLNGDDADAGLDDDMGEINDNRLQKAG